MKYILIFIFLITVNCSGNKSSNLHGSFNLISKIQEIEVNKNNRNDIISKLGSPPIISEFDNNIWFYIERKKTNQSVLKLGIKKIDVNHVLLLKFSSTGILIQKELLSINDMNQISFKKEITTKDFEDKNTLYNALAGLRERLNAPAKNRRKNMN